MIGLLNAYEGAPRQARGGTTVTLRAPASDAAGRWTLSPGAAVFLVHEERTTCGIRVPGFDSTAGDGTFVTDCAGLEPVDLPAVR